MTQEDKELLLKDLCARLPYGVKVKYYREECNGTLSAINFKFRNLWIISDKGHYDNLGIEDIGEGVWELKPYLRPISSMTEEELKTFKQLQVEADEAGTFEGDMLLYDWLNKNHLDYRLLIFQGLALEAPKGMYNV